MKEGDVLKSSIVIILSLLMLFVIAHSVSAVNDSGYYFGLDYLNSGIGGDFGRVWRYLGAGTAIKYIPTIDQAAGFGVTLGGYRGRLSGEVSYSFSEHDSYFVDSGSIDHYTSTFYDILSLDVKYSIIGTPSEKLTVFGLFGVGFPRFKVKEGAYDTASSNWIDESLTGLSYTIGIGTSLRFNSRICLNVDYIARRIEINGLDTSISHTKPVDELRAVERTIIIGMRYCY
jgi:hypothetical protein